MRSLLRLTLATTLFTSLYGTSQAQNVGINPTGAAPNVKALLDIDVSALPAGAKKGLLIPRVTRAQRLLIPGLGAGDAGLWVYQTDNFTVVADPTLNASEEHGFWYWDGATWQRWASAAASWILPGNANTLSTANYVGTRAGSPATDLHIRTTNVGLQPQMIITSGAIANVGVNPAGAPVERLDINGGLKVGNTALNTAGSIKYDLAAVSPNRWHYGNIDGTATGWQRLENAEREYRTQNYRPIDTLCQGATGQVILGSASNPGLAGNANTPLATNTGAGGNNRRGHHVQYIYRASELTAAGLCTGNPITAISFYVLGADVGPFPGADVQVEIRMRNTGINDFAVSNWDNTPGFLWGTGPGSYTNVLNTDSLIAYLGAPGWKQWNFVPAGFTWTGGNVVVDFCWLRNTTVGNSPQVALQTGFAWSPTKWVQVTAPANDINHGRTYRDVPLTPGALSGTTTNRPVTRFNGGVKTLGFVVADQTASYINYGGGLMVDTMLATGASADALYRGPGTVRARLAVYDGLIQLSDHVFDDYYGPKDAAAQNPPLGYAYVGVNDLKDYLEENRHLPNMPSRSEWETLGLRPLGELQTGLWETVETQALHITELEKDLSALEALAFAKPEDAADLDKLIADINASRRLSDAQKLHLTGALRQRMPTTPTTK